MKLGVFVTLSADIDTEFRRLRENGFSTCQLSVWDDQLKTDERAELVNRQRKTTKLKLPLYGAAGKDRQSGIFLKGRLP